MLFHLALALRLELSGLLDFLRGLLMVDVDEEDPRPCVDSGLVLAALARALALAQELGDPPRAFAATRPLVGSEIEPVVPRDRLREIELGQLERAVEAAAVGVGRWALRRRRRLAAAAPAEQTLGIRVESPGLFELGERRVTLVERPRFAQQAIELVHLASLQSLSRRIEKGHHVGFGLLAGARGLDQLTQGGVGGDAAALGLGERDQLAEAALAEQLAEPGREVGRLAYGPGARAELEAQIRDLLEASDVLGRRRGPARGAEQLRVGFLGAADLDHLLQRASGTELRVEPQHEIAAEQGLLATALAGELERLAVGGENPLLNLGREGGVAGIGHEARAPGFLSYSSLRSLRGCRAMLTRRSAGSAPFHPARRLRSRLDLPAEPLGEAGECTR